MRLSRIPSMFMSTTLLFRFTFAFALAAIMAACGGGSPVSDGGFIPYTGTGFSARPLPPEFTARQAVNYSPYRTANRDTETPTAGNVLQDLTLLQAGNIRLIRLFDSSDKVAKLTLEVIRINGLDIKVQLGIWINSVTSANPHLSPAQNQAIIDAAKAGNDAEIARGVALATDINYKNIILAVSVGNEMMVNWSAGMDPNVMAAYITTVRNQITQPVTSDDDWAFWGQANGNKASPTPVLNVIDFVSMHSYPMSESTYNQWDWKQASVDPGLRAQAMMDAAIAKLQADYAVVRSNLDAHGRTDLPVIIGETGWRAANTFAPDMTFRAGPVNQQMYFTGLNNWNHAAKLSGSGPANIFYFEAFDEPWKQGDDKWGLFNVNRQARCAVQGLSNSYVAEAGSCAASAAVYWTQLSTTVANADTYTLFTDSGAPDLTLYTSLFPNVWDSTTVWPVEVIANPVPVNGDPLKSLQFATLQKSWGWGQAYLLDDPSITPARAVDLSAMAYLNFSIKTTYAGALEVGFMTGSGAESSNFNVMLKISSGQYGFANDGAWHAVKIPIADIIAASSTNLIGGKDNFGNHPDLAQVTQPFIIADRYDYTGNAPDATGYPFDISRIFWSTN